MKTTKLLSAIVLLAIVTGCTKQQERFSSHSAPVKIADYLYEIEYSDYVPDNAENYIRTMENITRGGGCTVTRNGNFVGRNYDYFYSEMAEFVIHVPAKPGRYGSVGVATSIFELTPEMAEKDPNGEYFDFLPYLTVDGINDQGLYCNLNMVTKEGTCTTTGTNPGGEPLYLAMPVRYVLDNCATALEACQALEKANIIFSTVMGEFHLFIADKNDTYVVEIKDNKFIYAHPKDNIMTNFYVLTDAFLNKNDYGLLYPDGTERYDYVKEHYEEMTSKDAVSNVMKGIRYSQTYDMATTPFWYSEYYGHFYNGEYISIETPKEFYAEHIKETCEAFQNKTRNYLLGLWITTHTSVYDIAERTLRVYSQEDYDHPYEFKIK